MNVTIAVNRFRHRRHHPELANTVADAFDALGAKEGPHVHGTGIAGAIAAHARLMEARRKCGSWRSARLAPRRVAPRAPPG